MNRNLVCACGTLAWLAVAGCQETSPRPAAMADQTSISPKFTTVTLSADQLMSLDWGGREAGRSTIVDKRPAGAGADFDIRFPGNSEGICSIDYVSSGAAGQGALAGLNVSGYQSLALKFTLLSINGQNDPNHPLELAVGAVIGPCDGKLSACEPVVLGLAPEQATKVATTPMRTRRIRVIGIHAHVANPKVWDINGGVVTLRVEPVTEADILAAPALVSVSRPGEAARPETQAEPANPSDSQPHSEGARTTEAESRTKSSSVPTFGTNRIGAW